MRGGISLPHARQRNMDYEFIATAAFSIEGIVARELKALGIDGAAAENGRVRFSGSMEDAFRANLWLRASDRVMLVMSRFEARSFEELFQGVKAIAWEDILPRGAAFPVRAHCARSQLMSPSDCQKIVKKAVAERLKARYGGDWLDESGAEYMIDCAVHADMVTIALDTSGTALNRRGYRTWNGEAPLRETLAAAIISLTPWRPGMPLVDPCCGSGTLLCEAAMMAAERAPGLTREFAMERWAACDSGTLRHIREEAEAVFHSHDGDEIPIVGVDIDPDAADLARRHIKQCGFGSRIRVFNDDMRRFKSEFDSGAMIANPPYGERLGDRREARAVTHALRELMEWHPGFSLGVITSNSDFEREFGQRAARRRRLYNGRIECEFMLFDSENYKNSHRKRKQ